jgi:hypothetical protein
MTFDKKMIILNDIIKVCQEENQEENQEDLVMELVFSNQQTFKGLSEREYSILRRTSKITEKNQNIMNAAIAFKVFRKYDELYFIIVDGCYATHYASTLIDMTKSRAIFKRADKVRKHISEICKSDTIFRECFARVVMAEYKENLYSVMYDPNITHMDRFIYDVARSYFVRDLALTNPKKYIHDPEHFIFERYQYKFHDFEKEKGSIIALKRIYNREQYMDRIRGKRWYDEDDEEQYYEEYEDSDDVYSDDDDNEE